jgi:hypothetical protein
VPPLPPATQSADPHHNVKLVLKNVLVFGGLGAAAGVGASLLGLPLIGGFAAPIAALIGAGVGAALGLVKSMFDIHHDNVNTPSSSLAKAPAPLQGGGASFLAPPPAPGTAG